MAKWLQDNPQITIDQVKENIESQFKVKISRSTTHRVMQKLAFSYIKPRPKHVKQDPSKIANFKKNIQQEINKTGATKVFFSMKRVLEHILRLVTAGTQKVPDHG